MATAYYHWFFLIAPNGIPERMIAADPGYGVRSFISPLLGEGATIDPEVMEDYVRCFRDPATIAGSCADYRSASGIDLAHDEQSFAAGQRVECPVLVLWGTQAFVGRGYEPLSVWREYAATSAAGRCPPVISCPKRLPTWLGPP
jgi:haloacetate dehalogenase